MKEDKKTPILEIGVGPRAGAHIYQTLMANPVDVMWCEHGNTPLSIS